jgi:O-antigen/teichoic acid export membrane protein
MALLQDVTASASRIVRGPAAATTLTNLFILGGNALTGVVSARALGPTGRGQLALAVLWTAAIYMLGNLGLASSCSYYVARWPDRRPALAAWFKSLALRQAIAMTVASGGLLWWLHVSLRLPSLLAIEYTTWAAGATISLYATCYAQGLGDFTRFNLLRMIPGILPAGLMMGATVTAHLTVAEAAAAYLLPTWFAAILAVVWLRHLTGSVPSGPVSEREIRTMRSYGWRSLASFSGLMLNRSSDQLALGFLVPVSSLGLYSVAAAASSPLVSLVSSFGMVGLPTVTALAGRAKAKATWRTMWRATCLVAVISPVLAILLPRAIPLVYGPQYAAAVVPAEFVLLGALFTALATVADDLLRAYEHPGFVGITQGAGGAVTIIGILLLSGRPLGAVAIVSSLGFVVAFTLALIRLCAATRQLRWHAKHRIIQGDERRGKRRGPKSMGPVPVPVDLHPHHQPKIAGGKPQSTSADSV